MAKKVSLKGIWHVLKNSFKGFSEDKITKLSASLAYYTVFSLGPLLIVIIFLCSFFFGREAIEGTIYTQMESFVGHDAASQVEQIIKNASVGDKGTIAATIGVITLLIGATTVFAELQDSVNTIWGLKAKPTLGIWGMIKTRLLSFGLIGSLGFLLLVSLAVTALIEVLGGKLKSMFPDVGVVILYIVNLVLTLGVITILFAGIFKVLPDADVRWKEVWPGAIATGLLFLIGKFAISFYIGQSEVGSTYGAAGSLVILLVWIYYSSIILYFGAEFTKNWAIEYGDDIQPSEYAVLVKKVEVEEGKGSVQENEDEKNQIKEGKQPVENVAKEKQSKEQNKNKNKEPSREKENKSHDLKKEHNSGAKVHKITANDYTITRKADKPAGFGAVLGGLLLYFINRSSNRDS